ncbi:MAG: formyltetrahydrofolate deformylase [Acidimicrobiia bacterium]
MTPRPDTRSETAVLRLSCADQPGLVASVAEFIADNGGNIVHAEQHTDFEENVFFQRVEFELDGFALARDEIAPAFSGIAKRFGMQAEVDFSDPAPRVAILASREPHCLHDLLARWGTGELNADIPLVVSNHPDHAELAAYFGVAYHHLPVEPATKADQEAQVRALLAQQDVDLVVLARYMQILSGEFVSEWQDRIINIHHSFLPAFAGGRPYHQAHERGVKVIGATAHYATEDLDEGPIIAQGVIPVSHRDAVSDLVRKGRDIEKTVLAKAVSLHLDHRVLVHGRRTVVFD